jgi:hypothetical protein
MNRCAMNRNLAGIISGVALMAAVDGTRNAEISAAIKARVEGRKNTGMVVATIEPDGSSSMHKAAAVESLVPSCPRRRKVA